MDDNPGCPLCSPWDGCGWCGEYVLPLVPGDIGCPGLDDFRKERGNE
jgi:hypothetical protein